MQSSEQSGRETAGLSSWLLAVLALLIVSSCRLLVSVVNSLAVILAGDTWNKLTKEGSPTFDSWWRILLISEAAVQGAALVISLALLKLFFSRHRDFPRYAALACLVGTVAVGIDFIAANNISAIASDADYAPWVELVMSAVVCVVLVPVLLRSKRIRAAFRN